MTMARRFDDDPQLVLAAQGGDQAAFTTLFRRWFDPCVDVARRIVHDEETAAEVAQETFLVAWRQLDTLRDPSAFGGWVLRTTRNKALNRLERERRSVAVDQDDDPVLAGLEAVDDVAGDVAAAEQQQLVWAASAALGEREASVLDLHLRHGLDAAEIAAALDITTNNAHQVLFRMKGKLAGAIRAWVLFKGGDPSCPDLARALRTADATSFSAATVKVIDRHVADCEECTRRQAAILAPEAMFAAVPLLPVAGLLRERAASALRQGGVPLGPDAGSGPPPGAEADPVVDGESAGAEGGSPGPPSPGGAAVASGDRKDRRIALVVGAVVLVAVVVGVVLALRAGADAGTTLAEEPATTTTVEARSGTSVPSDLAPEVAPPSTVPDPMTTTTRPVTTTVAPPVVPPSPPPPPAAPTVVSFTATPAASPGAPCPPGQWSFTLSWSTTDATSVVMVPNAGSGSVSGGPSGTAQGCALSPGAVWTLTATGPGGTATAAD